MPPSRVPPGCCAAHVQVAGGRFVIFNLIIAAISAQSLISTAAPARWNRCRIRPPTWHFLVEQNIVDMAQRIDLGLLNIVHTLEHDLANNTLTTRRGRRGADPANPAPA